MTTPTTWSVTSDTWVVCQCLQALVYRTRLSYPWLTIIVNGRTGQIIRAHYHDNVAELEDIVNQAVVDNGCRVPSALLCDHGQVRYLDTYRALGVLCPESYDRTKQMARAQRLITRFSNAVTKQIAGTLPDSFSLRDLNRIAQQVIAATPTFGTPPTEPPLRFGEGRGEAPAVPGPARHSSLTATAGDPS